jgi:hypothetical protein
LLELRTTFGRAYFDVKSPRRVDMVFDTATEGLYVKGAESLDSAPGGPSGHRYE